jgi:transcriptional regulator with XRE-family HTH domain
MMLDSGKVWSTATREILRTIRGKRSQLAFSRRLGYRSNVAADWEGGHRSPTAAILLRAMGRVGIDVQAGFERFHAGAAPALAQGLPAWLRALKGHASQAELARRTGASRHQIRRWLSGQAEPRVPQFLALVEASSGRAADWVAALVDIDQVPSLAARHQAGRTAARLAFDAPWSAAVRLLLDTEAYRDTPTDAFLAAALGQDAETLDGAVTALLRAGLAERRGDRLVSLSTFTATAAASPDDRRRLKAHWARVAAERLQSPRDQDLVSLNLVTLSRVDLERVRELQRAYFRELRSLVAASEPEEVAAVVMMQVVTLSPGG